MIDEGLKQQQEVKAERLRAILADLHREKARAIANADGGGLQVVEAEIKETRWELEAL